MKEARRAVVWWVLPVLALLSVSPAGAARKNRTTKTAAPAAPAVSSEPTYTPSVTIAPEVLTPQGQPRMYPVGGGRESVWQSGMPVYIGDRLVLRMFASTGNAQLRELRVRVDNGPEHTLRAAPWVAEIDTTNWKPGYHFVEVYAASTDPNASPGSATAVFYVREAPPAQTAAAPSAPTTETTVTAGATQETTTVMPSTAVAGSRETPATAIQPPSHPGNEVTMQNGVPLYRAGLDITIHSSDAAVEKTLRGEQAVQVTRPTVFRVTAGSNARRYMYALTRDGKEIYRSESLPLNSMVRLQPKAGADGVGLLPGEVMLWVWAGDQNNNYGAPAMARMEIVAQP